jgi:hypothetical protein
MAEQDLTPSTVKLGHLQKLVKHEYMVAAVQAMCQRTLRSPHHEGERDPSICTSGEEMGLTPSPEV